MQSLFDTLNVGESLTSKLQSGEPPTSLQDAPQTLSGKAFAEAVLNSEEFRLYVIEGLTARDLPPAVLCRLMDHGWGKPLDRVEVRNVQNLDSLSLPELRAHLQERAASLATMMQLLDGDEDGVTSIH